MTDASRDDDTSYVGQYDWAETSPTTAITEAVADLVGQTPAELDPLYAAIDPDALEALLVDGDEETGVELSFHYHRHRITVHSDGTVFVTPQDS